MRPGIVDDEEGLQAFAGEDLAAGIIEDQANPLAPLDGELDECWWRLNQCTQMGAWWVEPKSPKHRSFWKTPFLWHADAPWTGGKLSACQQYVDIVKEKSSVLRCVSRFGLLWPFFGCFTVSLCFFSFFFTEITYMRWLRNNTTAKHVVALDFHQAESTCITRVFGSWRWRLEIVCWLGSGVRISPMAFISITSIPREPTSRNVSKICTSHLWIEKRGGKKNRRLSST